MNYARKINFRRLNIVTHRDVGYFLSGLIIIYSLSGLALNHVEDWNPDFILVKEQIPIPKEMCNGPFTKEHVDRFGQLIGEHEAKVFDFPTPNHIKIYYEHSTLLVDLSAQEGSYEKITRRPVFFESNILHRNSVRGWKWAADIFAVLLILINITGLFVLKGRNGIIGRGKWFIIAGMVPPVAAVIIFNIVQQ